LKYIGTIKDQWSLLTWTGLLSLLATTALLIATRDAQKGEVGRRDA
jgi:hypothetical protein